MSSADSPRYDDSLIRHHHDKALLRRQRAYFTTFVNGDYDGMKAMQEPGFTLTDIPLGLVLLDREKWWEANKGFTPIAGDLSVQCLAIQGSSEPGQISILENIVSFTLRFDPPPGIEGIPPGSKAGDKVAMVMCSAITWGEDGMVRKELEYGRLVWTGFNSEPWLKAAARRASTQQLSRNTRRRRGGVRGFFRALVKPLTCLFQRKPSLKQQMEHLPAKSSSWSLESETKEI